MLIQVESLTFLELSDEVCRLVQFEQTKQNIDREQQKGNHPNRVPNKGLDFFGYFEVNKEAQKGVVHHGRGQVKCERKLVVKDGQEGRKDADHVKNYQIFDLEAVGEEQVKADAQEQITEDGHDFTHHLTLNSGSGSPVPDENKCVSGKRERVDRDEKRE